MGRTRRMSNENGILIEGVIHLNKGLYNTSLQAMFSHLSFDFAMQRFQFLHISLLGWPSNAQPLFFIWLRNLQCVSIAPAENSFGESYHMKMDLESSCQHRGFVYKNIDIHGPRPDEPAARCSATDYNSPIRSLLLSSSPPAARRQLPQLSSPEYPLNHGVILIPVPPSAPHPGYP